ncbi:Amino acid transporter AVT1I [Vitis vinifera]|uniref:Amino acid transporter AVT1I n=1 Tax=Vitis vinifera TaxID=29760 RepID=A0A438CND7_VITVI|nr:Amino acid transporter AVT1I [Vitis vinifera]
MANNELRIPLARTTGSSSFINACFNGINTFLGMSYLTVPYALSTGGWLSLMLFSLVAIMTFYTGILLKRCMEAADHPSITSYLDIAGHAFGTKGRITVMIIMNLEIYLVAVGLLIQEVDSLLSLYIVSFGGHPVIPPIYVSMRDRYQFSKVLLFSFVLATLTYMSMAIVGYLMYGDRVESEITLNLPTSKVSARITIYTTLVIPIARYALVLTPIATAIEGGISENYKNKRAVRLFIRVALLFSTAIVAYYFPYYESLMAIVGSIFVVSGSFLLPCLCYLKISDLNWGWNCEQIGIGG